ncbi:MAG: kelch repeat-containing protein [Bacteroidia bacterium]
MLKRLLLLLCIISTQTLLAQQGWWTWMHGTNTIGSAGSFGTIGVAAATNNPPALYEAGEWTDLQGKFWIFGGLDAGGSGNEHAALWKFDPLTTMWTWVNGPTGVGSAGVYGTKGVPAPTNRPGARAWGMVTWVDNAGDLWLFGGQGFDGTGARGNLSDLWKYNIASNQWTWMNGPNTQGGGPTWGTQGVAAATNQPASRYESAASWTDNAGKLWMFGGLTYNPSFGNTNDLWNYDPSTNMWTWMQGVTTVNSPGNYGTMGVASATNQPRARSAYSKWKDINGNLWFFGGSDVNLNYYNDLWKYDIAANQWTWMHGSNVANSNGLSAGNCVFSATNDPCARCENRASWTDHCGNFWLFGGGEGGSFDSTRADMWYYKVGSGQWSRVSGTGTKNTAGSWGTMGTPASTNIPSARAGSVSFKAQDGSLWLFGGTGYWGTERNDLWRFVPDTTGCTPSTCAPLEATFAATNPCVLSPVSFTNSTTGATSYSWNFGDSQTSTAVNPTHPYSTAGTYTVVLIANNGTTTDTAIQVVTIHPKPSASITGNDTICAGLPTTLTGAGGTTYSWNTGATTAPISVSPAANTTYTLVVSNGFCNDTARVNVVVRPGPTVEAGNNDTVNIGGSVPLLATGTGTTYSWSPSTSLSCTTCPNPVASPTQTTEYIVTTASANGCVMTDTVVVFVTFECGEVYVPNFFSPNGDGKNESECVYGYCIKTLDFAIYDRWGEKVFETTDPKTCWDGTFRGKMMNSGVFAYYLKATLLNGKNISQKGNITLDR